ncbi:transposable element [Tanacetum coccineum]
MGNLHGINDAIKVKLFDVINLKKKLRHDGTIKKAHLVAKGYRQKEGQDFFDTYSPFIRITSIRKLIAIAAIHNMVIHQMDVKSAFLNGELDEEIYMQQPEGFVVKGQEHKVSKLVKSLYGLKQAPKQWHSSIHCDSMPALTRAKNHIYNNK